MEYDNRYDDPLIRNTHTGFVDFVIPHLDKNDIMVDLGCGACRKTIPLSYYVKSIDALDRSSSILDQAKNNISENGIKNISLINGDNLNTPFASHYYDVCVSALSAWNASEIHRIIKANGLFFIESLCPDDKIELKLAFGRDSFGKRGYLLNQSIAERLFYVKTSLFPFFEIENIQFWENTTTLTKSGLITLLEVTPTIRNFSKYNKKDIEVVDELCQDGTISFTEKRIMIKASAKDIGRIN